MISTTGIARKAGFSAALSDDTRGMARDRAQWPFKLGKVNRSLLNAFRRGYMEAEALKQSCINEGNTGETDEKTS